MKKKLILIGMFFLAIAIANADFGQSAGVLDFGNITLGENKTLSYWLVNTGEEELDFVILHPNDTIVNPQNGTIRKNGQQLIEVTVVAKAVGNFGGVIKAKAIQNITGTVVFEVELEKNYRYNVVENGGEFQISYLIFIAVIFLIFFAIYYYKQKEVKKWNRGK